MSEWRHFVTPTINLQGPAPDAIIALNVVARTSERSPRREARAWHGDNEEPNHASP